MRRIFISLLAVVSLLVLQGCFKIDMNLEIQSDDTVNGSFIVAFDEDMQALMEGDEGTTFDQEDLPEGATVEPWAEDGKVGQKVTFTDVPLAELGSTIADSEEGGFSLTREGDTYKFEATFDPTEGMDGESGMGGDSGMGEEFDEQMEALMETMFKDAEFTVSVTFPGKIIDTNGEVDGTTVTWDLDLASPETMHATAEEASAVEETVDKAVKAVTGDSGGFPVIPVVIGVLVLIALAGGGFLLARKNKDTTPSA